MPSRMSVPVGALESKSRRTTASSCSRLSKVEKSRSGKQLAGKTMLPCLFSSKDCIADHLSKIRCEIELKRDDEGAERTSHVQTAVYPPNLPSDVARGIRSQEMHHPCDLPGLGQPAHRDAALDAVEDLLGDGLDHFRRHVPGCDRVDRDADTVFSQLARAPHLETRLARECLRQAEQPGLGSRIVRLTDGPRLTDHRGDHDDSAAAALEHMCQRGLGEKERPGQIDSDDLVPFVFGHLGHRLVNRDAGVVDQDVQAAVLVDDLLDCSPAVVPAGDIALMDADLVAVTGCRQLGEELLRLLSVPAIPSSYRCALTGQALTDRRTDSPGTTRHEGNAPAELVSPTHLRSR